MCAHTLYASPRPAHQKWNEMEEAKKRKAAEGGGGEGGKKKKGKKAGSSKQKKSDDGREKSCTGTTSKHKSLPSSDGAVGTGSQEPAKKRSRNDQSGTDSADAADADAVAPPVICRNYSRGKCKVSQETSQQTSQLET